MSKKNTDKKKLFTESEKGAFQLRRRSEKKTSEDTDKKQKPKFDKFKKSDKKSEKKADYKPKQKSDPSLVRLNKYIANSGVCSRREADKLIESGSIKVNGKVVTELGTKVKRSDKVTLGDQLLKGEGLVYILMNKPKDCITTSSDPQGRTTVLQLLKGRVKERVYPVGRLDRQTTGLLLLTNDGDLSDKLMHPRNNISKLYHVEVDKSIKPSDLEKLLEGVELEDGVQAVDKVSYAGDKRSVGLELHSGKNRVVRRLFEALGYNVVKLDRMSYAGLTKKEIPRGKWRYLSDKEVHYLKML